MAESRKDIVDDLRRRARGLPVRMMTKAELISLALDQDGRLVVQVDGETKPKRTRFWVDGWPVRMVEDD